jgi:hypothetical protein
MGWPEFKSRPTLGAVDAFVGFRKFQTFPAKYEAAFRSSLLSSLHVSPNAVRDIRCSERGCALVDEIAATA